jgi:hypothetical protein
VDYRQATGPCWARYRAQQLWKGEDYVLSIDSHTRFIKNWDTKLIQLLSKCESPNPILTTYPLGYELPNEISKEGRPTLTCADRIAEDGMLRLKGRLLARPFFKPLPQMFWVSGFSFSRSDIIKECPYDPHLPHLFFGEESSMTLRLWTHGWDFFAPGQNIIYHLWSREHRPTFRYARTSFSATPQQRVVFMSSVGLFREIRDLKKEEIASQQRIKLLLGMLSESDIDQEHKDLVFEELDKYGLGTQRSREQFEAASGVSFSQGSVNETAMWGGHPKNIFAENLADLLAAAASSTTS